MADMHPGAQAFLEERTRLGVVTTLRKDGSPCTVPLWYDWDGTAVRFFSGVTSAKLKRLQNDPRITLTVSSEMDEDLYKWVSFEGRATVSQERCQGSRDSPGPQLLGSNAGQSRGTAADGHFRGNARGVRAGGRARA